MAELKPVYLISGSDRPKIRLALERLRGRFEEGAVEVLAAGESSGEDAAAACNALGLFGGEHRLVVVEEVDQWKAADAKAIAEYLKDPTPGTVLALVADEVKKESALAKACAKSGDVLVYDAPRKRDLPAWVAARTPTAMRAASSSRWSARIRTSCGVRSRRSQRGRRASP